ncbi:hypothetical protein SNEBB_000766 [Seison nebaliae]|nr:hypothetical protein SNEBB_000766 [Seison nebaliae]
MNKMNSNSENRKELFPTKSLNKLLSPLNDRVTTLVEMASSSKENEITMDQWQMTAARLHDSTENILKLIKEREYLSGKLTAIVEDIQSLTQKLINKDQPIENAQQVLQICYNILTDLKKLLINLHEEHINRLIADLRFLQQYFQTIQLINNVDELTKFIENLKSLLTNIRNDLNRLSNDLYDDEQSKLICQQTNNLSKYLSLFLNISKIFVTEEQTKKSLKIRQLNVELIFDITNRLIDSIRGEEVEENITTYIFKYLTVPSIQWLKCFISYPRTEVSLNDDYLSVRCLIDSIGNHYNLHESIVNNLLEFDACIEVLSKIAANNRNELESSTTKNIANIALCKLKEIIDELESNDKVISLQSNIGQLSNNKQIFSNIEQLKKIIVLHEECKTTENFSFSSVASIICNEIIRLFNLNFIQDEQISKFLLETFPEYLKEFQTTEDANRRLEIMKQILLKGNLKKDLDNFQLKSPDNHPLGSILKKNQNVKYQSNKQNTRSTSTSATKGETAITSTSFTNISQREKCRKTSATTKSRTSSKEHCSTIVTLSPVIMDVLENNREHSHLKRSSSSYNQFQNLSNDNNSILYVIVHEWNELAKLVKKEENENIQFALITHCRRLYELCKLYEEIVSSIIDTNTNETSQRLDEIEAIAQRLPLLTQQLNVLSIVKTSVINKPQDCQEEKIALATCATNLVRTIVQITKILETFSHSNIQLDKRQLKQFQNLLKRTGSSYDLQ